MARKHIEMAIAYDFDGTLADDINRSVIQDQVEMGVAVRMAAMDLLARNLRLTRAGAA